MAEQDTTANAGKGSAFQTQPAVRHVGPVTQTITRRIIPMKRSLGYVTLLVRDYDEAIAYFTGALSFELIEDRRLSDTKRWVLVSPAADAGTCLLLAKASTPEQERAVGAQCSGRVAFFLHTDDFARDYQRMRERGVTFLEPPRVESYGTVAVFTDICGNRWDLLQLNPSELSYSAG